VSGRNGYEARFYVSAAEIDRIQTGARAFINDPSRTRTEPHRGEGSPLLNIEGRVTQVSLTMDGQKQAFPVTAFFETADVLQTSYNKLVSGMGVDLSVETYRNERAIILSRNELVETGEGYTAFVAEQNTARKFVGRQVAVQVGHERDLSLEISGGLNAGDMLISEGARNLAPDAKINVASDPALLAAVSGR
jgi:hypothetical protein